MLEFTKAAEAREKENDPNEDVVEVNLWGLKVKAHRASSVDAALLIASGMRSGAEQVSAVLSMIGKMMGPRARQHCEALLWEEAIEVSDLFGGNDRHPVGVIDGVIAEFAGHPTQPSTEPSSSQAAGGRRSAVRSPGRGSTRSTTPSTGS